VDTAAAAAEIIARQAVIIVINRCCLPSNLRRLLCFIAVPSLGFQWEPVYLFWGSFVNSFRAPDAITCLFMQHPASPG